MFLDNLSIYSVPYLGVIFALLSVFSYKMTRKQQSTTSSNKSSLTNSLDSSTTLIIDDDQELIQIDTIDEFCETTSIKLCLDQDLESEMDIDN